MIAVYGGRKFILRRFIAACLDYFIFFVLLFLFIYLFGEEVGDGSFRVRGIKSFAMPLLWFFYFPVVEGIAGQTLGKKALDLHVIRVDGNDPDLMQGILRRIFDPIDGMFFGVMGILSINFSDKNQRLGDRVANTTVVYLGGRCKFCHTKVELYQKEAFFLRFTCPECGEFNDIDPGIVEMPTAPDVADP